MADSDQINPPGVVSAGVLTANAALSQTADVVNPTNADSVATNDSVTNSQNTNATESVAPIPERFPFVPNLSNGTSPLQSSAQNVSGGISGTGGSATSAASVTQARVERNTQSFVYRVTQVVSRFSQGRFTQDLEGVILNFDDIVANGTVNTNQAQDLNIGDAENQQGGFFGNAGVSNGSVPYTASNQNPVVTVNQPTVALDNTGGTGPASSQSATSAEGQDIGLAAGSTSGQIGDTSQSAQVIAKDD
jgi:hypothetical protein